MLVSLLPVDVQFAVAASVAGHAAPAFTGLHLQDSAIRLLMPALQQLLPAQARRAVCPASPRPVLRVPTGAACGGLLLACADTAFLLLHVAATAAAAGASGLVTRLQDRAACMCCMAAVSELRRSRCDHNPYWAPCCHALYW
jgi:hypothetical protein